MGKLKATIVLTGGPCAGKTTTIGKVKEYLEGIGYHVLLLSECATEVINEGIRPFGDNKVDVFDFQNEILKLQLFKEERFNKIISKLPDVECIVLCDRGIIDNKAYLGYQKFRDLLDLNNLKEEDLLKKYDLVIHLTTVANDLYNVTTNTARFENSNEAILLDLKTSDAWKEHSNLKIVKCEEQIENKIKNVINIVDNYLKDIK